MVAVSSTQPAHTKNVSSRFGWRPRNQKNAGTEPASPRGSFPDAAGGTELKRRRTGYWAAGAAVILLGAGVGIGATLPDPKNSSEFRSLSAEASTLRSDLKSLQSNYDSLDANVNAREEVVDARESAAAEADAAVKEAEAALKKREDAVKAAEKTQAAKTITEGTWTVGVDIQPGTYRASANVSSSCYWGIYRTGSNGSDIIENDIVNGGRPSVTLSAGQDFTTTRCGSWLRQ